MRAWHHAAVGLHAGALVMTRRKEQFTNRDARSLLGLAKSAERLERWLFK
jgi:hypothetical protein